MTHFLDIDEKVQTSLMVSIGTEGINGEMQCTL
jgi:hypothetical protein